VYGGGPEQFKSNYFTEMCSGSEEGSYLRFIDVVYHSTLGLRVLKKKKRARVWPVVGWDAGRGSCWQVLAGIEEQLL